MKAPKKGTCPAMLHGRRPGSESETTRFYAPHPAIQAMGVQFARGWVDAAEGFVSSFWRSLVDEIGPAVRAVLDEVIRADVRLDPQDFPMPAHWNLTAILCGFAECNLAPTAEAIVFTAGVVHLPLPLGEGDAVAELVALSWRETSAALLLHYAHELREHHRKAQQLARLWRKIRTTMEPSVGNWRAMQVIARRPMANQAGRLQGRVVS